MYMSLYNSEQTGVTQYANDVDSKTPNINETYTDASSTVSKSSSSAERSDRHRKVHKLSNLPVNFGKSSK